MVFHILRRKNNVNLRERTLRLLELEEQKEEQTEQEEE